MWAVYVAGAIIILFTVFILISAIIALTIDIIDDTDKNIKSIITTVLKLGLIYSTIGIFIRAGIFIIFKN